jgi:hypothetical protein
MDRGTAPGGVVGTVSVFRYGCIRVCLTLPELKDGKRQDLWLDEQDVEQLDGATPSAEASPTGGTRDCHPRRDDTG